MLLALSVLFDQMFAKTCCATTEVLQAPDQIQKLNE